MTFHPFNRSFGSRFDTPTPDPVVLLTSYGSGATSGKNLGSPGYSYDFVAQIFKPLLTEWGPVIDVDEGTTRLEHVAARVQAEGKLPIHVCFRALQHMTFVDGGLNVCVPAWEFPDLPDHAFDGDPQNDWIAMANRCDQVIVGGPFTARAFANAGVRTPVCVVPVPPPDRYFDAQNWSAERTHILKSAVIEPNVVASRLQTAPHLRHAPSYRDWALRTARRVYSRGVRSVLPRLVDTVLTPVLKSVLPALRAMQTGFSRTCPAELSGVIYTSIFNPLDGRKNWEDLVSSFLHAFRDCPDATLVLKIIHRNPLARDAILQYYRRLDLTHACRLLIIDEFLDDDQMDQLLQATTYYVTSTRAEGNCLPLMNYLAAGRPAITPAHTAIGDYFDGGLGWVVDSHPEPAAWPHDLSMRLLTSWHRVVWPSLCDGFRHSYQVAKWRHTQYQELSTAARQRMTEWCSTDRVRHHLRQALVELLPTAGKVEIPLLAAG